MENGNNPQSAATTSSYDVIVVGAGIAGCTLARELSRYQLSILVLERGFDIACGATRTNSGIVHGGFDPEPGTTKAHYNKEGRALFEQMAAELGFRFSPNGSLVVAFTDEELTKVHELHERGIANETPGLSVISAEKLYQLEPHISPGAKGALLCESSGICDPFGMCLAYAENAATNGVTFHFEEEVVGLERDTGHAERGGFAVRTREHTYEARVVANCAGVHADEIAALANDNTLSITPVRGEYYLFDRVLEGTFTHTVFQVPTKAGKGVLVTPTVEGNILTGPNAVVQHDKNDMATKSKSLQMVLTAARKSWDTLPERLIITNFAGLRPKEAHGDFVIGASQVAPGLFHIAGFESPGLTCAPAVAKDVAQEVATFLGAQGRADFVATRTQPPRFSELSAQERRELCESNPDYREVICRCEQVTKAEILDAIHSPVPAHSIDAVRRRSRAGTGRCQGSFCTPLIAELLAHELGIPVRDVLRSGAGSELGVGGEHDA